MESFIAVIQPAPRGGAFVAVPAEVLAALGEKGRVPVQASLDGIAYRGSVVSMGGSMVLGILKAIRSELGKGPGDTITVALLVDKAPRAVVLPEDLRAALEEAVLLDDFAALAYTHQREYVTWVEEAKKPETRQRRVSETVARLRR